MPTLPSGLYLAVYKDHILPPDTNWFKAPEGHFWYWTPAPEFPPPFKPEDVSEAVPASAPLPKTREEMAKFVRVVIGLPDGKVYWQGDFLSDFPFFMTLSDEDKQAWDEWVATEAVQEFLDHGIQQCAMQAAINKDAQGYVVTQSDDSDTQWKKVINPLDDSQ